MRRSGKVVIGLLATVAVGACSDGAVQQAESRQDCVDNRTNRVVSRDYCNPGHASYLPFYVWYYGGSAYRNGGGMYVRGGSYTALNGRNATSAYGTPSRSVSRGVIGGRSSGST
jgi:hypothetical protein